MDVRRTESSQPSIASKSAFDTDSIKGSDGGVAVGLHRPRMIAIIWPSIDNEAVVKHEIVHELVGGDPKHNSPLFGICSGRAG